ncbi:hypothetical protein IFM89_013402 [Coptis chinensis]|uniref:FAD-binding domain-containing protein n=1 Tax=Coptis chinensis TaxID=261450 RepID=A0A835I4S7_9MAGN|nr:hypothetical protein IFM89_013402 [Coptis chinensis]
MGVQVEMEIKENVVIVGGGIAGLATALALKKVGIKTLVLESNHELRTTGAALTLYPNAWRALDALGVSDKLTAIYPILTNARITDVATGAVQVVSFDGIMRPVHRSTLLDTLAQELPKDAIRFSSKLKSIENLRDNGSSIAVLTLEDGTIVKAKVVIGCDGVHSVVARWLGLSAPIHSGRAAVRGISVYPEGHGMTHELQQFIDIRSRGGLVTLNDKELYWFVTYKSAPNVVENRKMKSPELIQQRMLENITDYPPVFVDVVQHSDLRTLTWAPLMLRVPWNLILSDLYKENITVAGDAMHPTTPDLGQGGCSSLEDAVVIARHIGNYFHRNGEFGSDALKGYTKERRWRVAMIISASYLSGWIQGSGSGWFMKFFRDKVFYNFFSVLSYNVVHFNCGQLPKPLLAADEENSRKKLE